MSVRVPVSVKRKRSSTTIVGIPKTPKLASPQFRHGAIRTIFLHNFLTFNDVVLHPSPQLNVIVGPNGTGKSSLVCAMCLGLGGRASLLGRAKQLKDFVKHGSAKEAFIEITLHHESGNHPCIRREIKKETSTSKWFLNGREKTDKDMNEFIKKFDIQLENKCQFLPQDKVVEFAKLDCYQLLEETEKAIGTEDMYRLHQDLKASKTSKLELEKSLNSYQKEVDKLKRVNVLLERDVTRVKTMMECRERIKHLKWKKYWLEYNEARSSFNDCRSKRRNAESKSKDLRERYEPLIKRVKEKVAIVKSFQTKEERSRQRVNDANKTITNKQSELLRIQDEQVGVTQDYKAKLQEEDNRKREIAKLSVEMQSFRTEMEGIPQPGTIQPQIANINEELKAIRLETVAIQEQQQPLEDQKYQCGQRINSAKMRLREIEDVFNQRLSKLDHKDQQTARAIDWLRQNKSMFQQTIHLPVIVLLQIKNMKYAPQVEDFFMGKDAYSFVCESKQDYDLFCHEVRDRLNLKVNVVLAPERQIDQYQPAVPLANLTQYGFKHMLLDIVEAPPPVLSYFCQYHYLQNVPLADTANVAMFIASRHSVQKFYVGNDVYIAKRSNYSNKTISRSNHIRPCQFFLSSVDEVERATLLSSISEFNDAIATIDGQLVDLGRREVELRRRDGDGRKRRNTLKESLNERNRLNRNIQSREIQIDQLNSNPINIEGEKLNYKNRLAEVLDKKNTCLTKIAENLKLYRDMLVKQTCAHLDLSEAELRKKHYDSEKESVMIELKQAEDEVEKARVEENESKNKARGKLNVARKETGFSAPEEISNSQYRHIFQDLPNELQAIEECIHEQQAQADLCGAASHDNGKDIMKQYESRKKEIEGFQEKLEEVNDQLSSHSDHTSGLRDRWLGPLEEMIREVNKRFGAFFSLMGCNGEVSLLKHDFDYSKYGVEIRVKFRREEQLQLLDSHRQSGGERSVSTMMYLMALQDITSCPFRVVDEINQGMDSTNERRVFNLIVETVKDTNTSQYFMLTPKLLQDLNYSECVTVHTVHNGPEMLPYNQW